MTGYVSKFPLFKERENQTLIETKKLYNAPAILNAIFIFYNKRKGQKKILVNEEVGHKKINNASTDIRKGFKEVFFSAEAQNRQHGGISGAPFILKDWWFIYYKMPLAEHEFKEKYKFKDIITYMFKTKTYPDGHKKQIKTIKDFKTETSIYNEKTGEYDKIIFEVPKKSQINDTIELALEEYNEYEPKSR